MFGSGDLAIDSKLETVIAVQVATTGVTTIFTTMKEDLS
jgi:hypothetical protein